MKIPPKINIEEATPARVFSPNKNKTNKDVVFENTNMHFINLNSSLEGKSVEKSDDFSDKQVNFDK